MVYTKGLERAKYLALQNNNDNYNKVMQLPDDISADLNWWNLNVIDTRKKIGPKHFKLEIFSNASRSGWGVLELLAAFFCLKCFAATLRGYDILLRIIDNTTAIAYVNRMGGIRYPTLNNLAKEIWQWCEA
ncbi:hypothetical protein NQ317_019809 [Molorchus minor]|uniref:Uncharacterized protein n=1 Tax=Molorchus minor TaxID=1323400 RepID=A0ABQ9ISY2_9CUCU|nr:hypothetical protein NQ317_019809 [Molorchus minor]